jgi:hypothetical protein
LWRGGGQAEDFSVRVVGMISDGLLKVLDAAEVNVLHGSPGLFKAGCHAKDAEVDESSFIQ